MLVATEASDSFGFKGNWVGKVRSIQEWVSNSTSAREEASLVLAWDG